MNYPIVDVEVLKVLGMARQHLRSFTQLNTPS